MPDLLHTPVAQISRYMEGRPVVADAKDPLCKCRKADIQPDQQKDFSDHRKIHAALTQHLINGSAGLDGYEKLAGYRNRRGKETDGDK